MSLLARPLSHTSLHSTAVHTTVVKPLPSTCTATKPQSHSQGKRANACIRTSVRAPTHTESPDTSIICNRPDSTLRQAKKRGRCIATRAHGIVVL